MKNAALGVALGLSALVGCQGPSQVPGEAAPAQSPSLTAPTPTRNGERLEFKGIALDQSFFRMAYKPMPSERTEMAAWLKGHPRLAGVPSAHLDRMAAVLTQRGDVAVNNVGNAQLLSTSATWTITETHGMNTSAGVLVIDSANPSNTNDRVVVEGAGAGTAGDPAHYIGILSSIYTATPTVVKSPALDSAIDGSALLLSIDGAQVYALTSAGTLYAIKLSDGTIAWQISLGSAVSWSTPWIDFGNGDIFVADTGGHLTSISSAGAQHWKTAVSASALHSSPIQFGSQVFVGADDGKLYRVNSSTGAAIGTAVSLCLTASCVSLDQIWGGLAIDTLNNNNKLIVPANKRLIQIDLNACTAATTTCAFTGFKIDEANFTSQQGRIFGSPTIDNAAGGFIYIGHDNRMWRAAYNNGISGNFARATTPNATGVLRGFNSAGNEYPRGIPIVFNNQIFIGDGGGWLHRFDTTTWSESAQKSFAGASVPNSNGPTIDSTPLIDFSGGNVYFGTRAPNGTGSWVSLAQSFTSDAAVAGGAATTLRFESSANAVAGSPFSVTITALDAFNNPATGYTGTVHFTSTDAGGAILPANYTFVAGDAGSHTFTNATTLATTGATTMTATDTVTASIKGSASIFVAPGAVAKFNVVTYPASNTTTAGTANTLVVQAVDSLNHVVTSYAGTIHFTSSDGAATLPANYTFTAGSGSATFWFGATLRTAGVQTITATDVGTPALTGTLSLTVNGGPAKTLVVTAAPSSSAAGAVTTVTVTAKDAGNNTVTGYVGTVAFTSTDGAATLPGNYTFVAGDNGTHSFSATLRTVGSRTITVTDTTTSTIKGSATVTVTAGGATTLRVYNYPASATVTHGVAFTVGVQALDAGGNVVPNYTGTIHFTSNDGTATLPTNWTFNTSQGGTATFWSGAKLNTIGAGKTVTATDTVTGTITGTLTVQVL